MLILGLLDMYFDAAVVFVTNSSLLFRLALAILCTQKSLCEKKKENTLKNTRLFCAKIVNPILKTKLVNQKFSNYFKANIFFFENLVIKFWFSHCEQGNRGKLHISVSMQQQAPDLKIDLLSESSEANSPYSPSRSLTGLAIIKSNLNIRFLAFWQ